MMGMIVSLVKLAIWAMVGRKRHLRVLAEWRDFGLIAVGFKICSRGIPFVSQLLDRFIVDIGLRMEISSWIRGLVDLHSIWVIVWRRFLSSAFFFFEPKTRILLILESVQNSFVVFLSGKSLIWPASIFHLHTIAFFSNQAIRISDISENSFQQQMKLFSNQVPYIPRLFLKLFWLEKPIFIFSQNEQFISFFSHRNDFVFLQLSNVVE